MQDSHSCDPGSIPGQCNSFLPFYTEVFFIAVRTIHDDKQGFGKKMPKPGIEPGTFRSSV